jgi:hypothetical protein
MALRDAQYTVAKSYVYSYIAAKPCLRCGRIDSEVAHLAGFPSLKQAGMEPRRKGLSALCCIPLCGECHRTAKDSLHEVGEQNFSATFGKPEGWIYHMQARLMAEALVEYMRF